MLCICNGTNTILMKGTNCALMLLNANISLKHIRFRLVKIGFASAVMQYLFPSDTEFVSLWCSICYLLKQDLFLSDQAFVSFWCRICFSLIKDLFSSDAAVFGGRSIRLSATAARPIPYKANRMKRHKSLDHKGIVSPFFVVEIIAICF